MNSHDLKALLITLMGDVISKNEALPPRTIQVSPDIYDELESNGLIFKLQWPIQTVLTTAIEKQIGITQGCPQCDGSGNGTLCIYEDRTGVVVWCRDCENGPAPAQTLEAAVEAWNQWKEESPDET